MTDITKTTEGPQPQEAEAFTDFGHLDPKPALSEPLAPAAVTGESIEALQTPPLPDDAVSPGELVFFFDGEFRTLAEMERRAAVNAAIAAHLARTAARDLRQAA